MKITFETKGFPELERALAEELPKATARNVLVRSGINAMKRIEDRMRQLAPRQEGDLADSMTTQRVPANRGAGGRYARSTGVEIETGPAPAGVLNRSNAGWQERGTVKMPANPYARPAADAESDAVIDDVRAELTLQIEKAKARIARKAAKG